MLATPDFFSSVNFSGARSRLGDAESVCVGIELEDNAEAWWTAALPWASAAEQVNARRFLRRMDAVRHLLGRALARTLLVQELGGAIRSTEFIANRWGKPGLPGGEIEFSIAHSGNAVWVALCRAAPVGIDIESADAVDDPHALAEMFHPDEYAALLTMPAADARSAFLRCWTRKEAVVKALGEGLSRPLTSFCVRTDECCGNWLVEPPAGTDGWTVADLKARAGYFLSVAVMAPDIDIVCRY